MSREKPKFSYGGYDEYLYTGLQGIIMRRNHKILSANICPSLNRKILEIGGGAKPHCSVVELKDVGEYWVSDSAQLHQKLSAQLPENLGFDITPHIIDNDPTYQTLKDNDHRFSRIIASHVWEHVDDPEGSLLDWIDLLEDDGQLDIAIPCDPGWGWRLAQLIGRRKAIKTYNLTHREIDLVMAREHVNACQNLTKIMRYYCKTRPRYFPFFIPFSDFNLFMFFRIKKSDFGNA